MVETLERSTITFVVTPDEGVQECAVQKQSFEEYQAAGGIFSFSFFDFIQNFKSTVDIDQELAKAIYVPARLQARNMASESKIKLSPEESQIYELLRELDNFSFLVDQRLLAEIIRITEPQKHKSITTQYSNIFAV